MALGRETVGTAYVKILADGSGLDRSIKEEIRGADDGVRAEGKRQGGAYADEFKKGVEHEDIFKGLNNNFERSLARTKMADRFFNSAQWRKFQDKLHEEFGDAGIVAGFELQKEFRHNVNDGLDQSTADIGKRMDRIREKMEQPAKDFEKQWRASLAKIETDIERLGSSVVDFDQVGSSHFRNTVEHIRDLNDEITSGTSRIRRWHREMQSGEPIFARFQDNLDRIADGVGSAFGRGSRNNFINFVGSMARGLTRIFTTTIPKMLDLLVAPFQEAIGMFKQVRDAGGSVGDALVKSAGAFAISLAEIPLSLVGIVAAAGLAYFAVQPLVGLMSLLLGTVLALTASISFGLMGALAPLVGLLAPIAVSGFAVAAAFIGMNDHAKKLMKEAIEPLKRDLKELGDAARPGILRGIQTAAENLRQPLKQLKPLFTAAGDGLATFAGAFTDAVTGPGFNKFVSVMTRQLPGEMNSLGDALGHVFDGFLGALASLNRKGGPVESFLGWLTGISQTFDDWTTKKVSAPSIDLAGGIKQPGAAAQTGFEGFMEKIQGSAEALKGVLNPLWDIIKQLMNAGQPAGDSMLTSLGNTLQDLSDWLEAHPDDVSQWFDDAVAFAKAIGGLAVEFAKLVAVVDSPGGRKTTTWLITMAGLAFSSGVGGLILMGGAMNALGSIHFDKIGDGLDKVGGAFQRIKDKLSGGLSVKGIGINWSDILGAPAHVQGLAQSLIVKAFSGLAGKAKNVMGKFDLSSIISGVGKVIGAVTGPFQGLAKRALNSMGTFNIVDIVRGLGSIAKDIISAFPSAHDILHAMGTFDIGDVVQGLGSIASTIISAFPGASEILAAIGHIDLSSLMHGSFTLPGGHKISWAEGGLVFGPRFGLVGEAGPEAIVPLARPLHLVDPAVRELSAIAQGLHPMASGGVVTPRPTIDASGWTIVSPTKDPSAVASEVINRLVAVGY